MYTLLKKEGKARRGQFETVHGTFQTLYECRHSGGYQRRYFLS